MTALFPTLQVPLCLVPAFSCPLDNRLSWGASWRVIRPKCHSGFCRQTAEYAGGQSDLPRNPCNFARKYSRAAGRV